MKHEETYAVTPTHGPRPAGKPTECFYCHVQVGGTHKTDCPCRVRTVVMRYTFEVVIPYSEDADVGAITFSRNESSWCANNALRELEKRNDCWCSGFTAEFVRDATAEDEAAFDLDILNR